MQYRIFENGTEVNIIEADEAFCSAYCLRMGYTYEEMPIPLHTAPEPTVYDELAAAYSEGVNSIDE